MQIEVANKEAAIKKLKEEQEKLIETLNANFDKAMEKKQKEHEANMASL